jgi:hypothetical protein
LFKTLEGYGKSPKNTSISTLFKRDEIAVSPAASMKMAAF